VGLTGKLGSLGQPVLRATSAKMARQFGDNLKTEIERGGAWRSA
jgi:carbon monoxide dehydrogenase subunit G